MVYLWDLRLHATYSIFMCNFLPNNLDHFLIMLTSKSGHPSICEKEPRCQDHIAMNDCILGNPYKFHKWNEAKVVDHAKNIYIEEFDRLQIEAQHVLEVCKHILVKLVDSMVCKILGIEARGVGLLESIIISILEKDDDLVVLIKNSRVVYAKEMCMTCEPKCEKQRPFNTRRKKEIQAIVSYHEP